MEQLNRIQETRDERGIHPQATYKSITHYQSVTQPYLLKDL